MPPLATIASHSCNVRPKQPKKKKPGPRCWTTIAGFWESIQRSSLPSRARPGPKNACDFLVQLAARLVDRMAPVIEELDDDLDGVPDLEVRFDRRQVLATLTPGLVTLAVAGRVPDGSSSGLAFQGVTTIQVVD